MHPSISINSLSLAPAQLRDKVECVARLGARAIGPLASEVGKAGAQSFTRQVRDAGIAVSNLTHLGFGIAAPEKIAAEQDRLKSAIEWAAAAGSPNLMMITGARGGNTWPQAAQRFAEAMAPCAEFARQAGVTLSIEPVSPLYAHGSFVHRLSDAVRVARAAGISVSADLFACWTDADIDEAIADAGPLIAFVQVSDYIYGDSTLPCRAVPGDGEIPLERLIGQIAAAGFTGYYDIEQLGPRIEAEGHEAALTRAAAHIGAILEGLGQ